MSASNGASRATVHEESEVRVADVAYDPKAAAALEIAHRKGGAFWWSILLALVLLSEQTALAVNLLAPALGPLATEFETTQIIWTITAFVLVGGVVTPLAGKLADIYGKRRVLLVLGVISTTGAAVAALAPNFAWLMVGRVMGGVAMAFLPLIYSLIRDIFPERRRSLSISIATNGVGVVTVAGPFLAGWLIDDFGARAVFWFVVLISIPGLLLTRFVVPETPVRAKTSVDWLGALLLGGGLGALLLGLNQAQTWGWGDARTLACLIGGVVALIAWVQWERTVRDPLVSIPLLRSRPVATVLAATALATGALTAIASFLAMQIQTPRAVTDGGYGFGLSATEVAVWFLPAGILTVLSGVFVGLTAKKIGFRNNTVIAALLVAFVGVWLGLAHDQSWMIIFGWGVAGMGAMLYATMPNLLMRAAPVDQRGVAAGMGATAVAVTAAVITQIVGIILNNNVDQVIQGAPIYANEGYATGFVVAGAVAFVGALVALLIPRDRAQESDAPAATPTEPTTVSASRREVGVG